VPELYLIDSVLFSFLCFKKPNNIVRILLVRFHRSPPKPRLTSIYIYFHHVPGTLYHPQAVITKPFAVLFIQFIGVFWKWTYFVHSAWHWFSSWWDLQYKSSSVESKTLSRYRYFEFQGIPLTMIGTRYRPNRPLFRNYNFQIWKSFLKVSRFTAIF
jgi:hypothetical protein